MSTNDRQVCIAILLAKQGSCGGEWQSRAEMEVDTRTYRVGPLCLDITVNFGHLEFGRLHCCLGEGVRQSRIHNLNVADGHVDHFDTAVFHHFCRELFHERVVNNTLQMQVSQVQVAISKSQPTISAEYPAREQQLRFPSVLMARRQLECNWMLTGQSLPRTLKLSSFFSLSVPSVSESSPATPAAVDKKVSVNGLLPMMILRARRARSRMLFWKVLEENAELPLQPIGMA